VGQEVLAIAADVVTPEPRPGTPPDEAGIPPEDSQAAVARHTAVMAVGTGLSRVTGFLRVMAMTAALGVTTSRLADAYATANTTPNILYELVLGGVLSSVFVPVFVEWQQQRGKEAAWEIARRVMTITLVVLSAVALLGIVVAPLVIDLYVRDAADEATRELATFFLRWFVPQIVFYGVGAVATGLLNANRRFAAPMFAPVLNNLVAIGTFVTFLLVPGPDPTTPATISDAQRNVLAIGTTLGVVAMTVALWPALRRLGWRFAWRGAWRDEAVRHIGALAKWTVVYVASNQLAYLLVVIIAFPLGKGDYTAYTVAFIVFQLPHAIFAVSIFTALLTGMSARWSAHDVDGYRTLLSRGVRMTAVVIVPAAAGYIALSGPIARLLFQYGNNTAEGARLIGSILFVFAFGLFPFSLFQLLLRAFYGMQDTRTPALINVGAAGVNVGANLLFVYVADLDVQGLALGHATGYVVASAAALTVMRRRIGGLDGRRTAVTIARVVSAAIPTSQAAWGVERGLRELMGAAGVGARLLAVGGGILAGVLVFAVTALILRIEEVDTVKRMVSRRPRP